LGLRKYGIVSCQASGYGSDGYFGYCGATSYGDYARGAIWFNLEAVVSAAAANAKMLFPGNSRTQIAFSSKAIADWFSSLSVSYYLLGSSHFDHHGYRDSLSWRPKRIPILAILIDCLGACLTGGKTILAILNCG